MAIKVAIVEDNEEIRGMLVKITSADPEFHCVYTSSTGESALRLMSKYTPDVVVMDLRLPDISGIECTARLKQLLPETQVLVYTVYGDNEQVFKALEAGASGYLLKRSAPAEILEAIRDVYSGGSPMSGVIARKVVLSFRKTSSSGAKETEHLTPREAEVLSLLARGLVTKEIGQDLGISFDTVRYHLKHIYTKLHVRSRTEAVLKYIR